MSYPESIDAHGLLRGRENHVDGGAELAIAGELDLASAKALFDRIARLAAEHPDGDVVVDLADLEFLGSTGIQALLATHRGLADAGRRLVLRNVHGEPMRTLDLTGVSGELTLE